MNACVCVLVLLVGGGAATIFQVVPEDLPMAVVAIYGFSPPLRLGRDHRVGFGFRFGNHADLQLMYEFGPQIRTKPLQPVKVRSAAYRVQRRRPLVELLLRAGLLHELAYDETDGASDEPR